MNFSFFTVFLKNRNTSSKIKRSKVTEYAALIVYYTSFLYMRATSGDFSLFHARSLSKNSNKSAHLAVLLEPLPNRKCGRVCVPETAFVQNCRPNTKGSNTLVGRLRKAGMYPALIYLSIYFFNFN